MSNNKFKVLIVEDEANICSFIETLLTTNGYQALVAHTCTMGLTLFSSHNPDLVILDLGLPDRDGLELIRTVRQKYMTPIIVLSARTDEMDKIEALDLGANDYITKPSAPVSCWPGCEWPCGCPVWAPLPVLHPAGSSAPRACASIMTGARCLWMGRKSA